MPWIAEVPWRLAVLDEAQAIKNPDAKQTRAVKKLKAGARLALTGHAGGEPAGRSVVDLRLRQSGTAGNGERVHGFAKRLRERPHSSYGPLRELVRPYILRRLKTDKTVIADLPDKTEIKAFCPLSRHQAALYEQAVKELAAQLAESTGIQRKGLVLSFLMRFKQICNHPSQWLARRRLGRSRQRQMGAPARNRRGDCRQAGEDAGLYPVPRGHRAARRFPRVGFRTARPGAARRNRSEEAQGTGARDFRKTKPSASSCFRSRPAARA